MIKNSKFCKFVMDKRFYLVCSLLSILFLINCFWGNAIFVVYPILLIFILIDNLQNGLSYAVFCVPFCSINIYLGTILFFVCVVALIIKFYVCCFLIKKEKPNLKLLAVIGGLLVYCLLPIGEYNLNWVLKIALIFILFATLGILLKNTQVLRFKYNIKLLSISVLISVVFGLTYFVSPFLQDKLIVVNITENLIRYQALFNNANVLAMFCEVICAVLLYYIMSKKACWQEYLLFILLSLVGFTTFSKTYLILIFIIYITFFIWGIKQNYKKTLAISGGLVAIALLVCVFKFDLVNTYFNRFIGKFSNCKSFADFMNMLTTNRYELWTVYLSYIFKNPLVLFFGRGLGAPALVSSQVLSAHNCFISMIYQLGIVGVCLFITVFVLLIKNLTYNKKFNPNILLPICILSLLLCVEDVIFFIFY